MPCSSYMGLMWYGHPSVILYAKSAAMFINYGNSKSYMKKFFMGKTIELNETCSYIFQQAMLDYQRVTHGFPSQKWKKIPWDSIHGCSTNQPEFELRPDTPIMAPHFQVLNASSYGNCHVLYECIQL